MGGSTGPEVMDLALVVFGVTPRMPGVVLLLFALAVLLLLNSLVGYQAPADSHSVPINLPARVTLRRHTILVIITDVHRGMIPALEYALSFGSDDLTAVYVDLDAKATRLLQRQWQQWGLEVPLEILASPDGSLVRPLLHYVDRVASRCGNTTMTIVLPQLAATKWWHHVLHNRPALLLKAVLVFGKRKNVLSVPYQLEG